MACNRNHIYILLGPYQPLIVKIPKSQQMYFTKTVVLISELTPRRQRYQFIHYSRHFMAPKSLL